MTRPAMSHEQTHEAYMLARDEVIRLEADNAVLKVRVEGLKKELNVWEQHSRELIAYMRGAMGEAEWAKLEARITSPNLNSNG